MPCARTRHSKVSRLVLGSDPKGSPLQQQPVGGFLGLCRSCGLTCLQIVLERYQQHAEALPIFLTQMLVMHFVRFANGHQVGVVRAFEPLDPLMYEDLVDQEVRDPVRQDAQAEPRPRCIQTLQAARDEEPYARYGEDQEEAIVPFQEAGMVLLVMVRMEIPQPAVHHVLVCRPRHDLHRDEGDGHDPDDHPCAHAPCNT